MRAQLKFWVFYPFVMFSYVLRRRRDWQKIVPPIWLSPGELMARDFEHFDGEGKDKIDQSLIPGLAKSRDETLIHRQEANNGVGPPLIFLLSNYFAIGTEVSTVAFSEVREGVPEGLMLKSNLMSVYTLLLQTNVYLMEAAIRFFVKSVISTELRQFILSVTFLTNTLVDICFSTFRT